MSEHEANSFESHSNSIGISCNRVSKQESATDWRSAAGPIMHPCFLFAALPPDQMMHVSHRPGRLETEGVRKKITSSNQRLGPASRDFSSII